MRKLGDFLKHFIRSNTLHGTHSPFVYALIKDCIYHPEVDLSDIESHYAQLKHDQTLLSGMDYGKSVEANYTVGRVARTAMTAGFESNFLARLANHFSVNSMLELGGNIGKGSASVASINPKCQIVSVEGNKAIAAFAQRQFKALKLSNVAVVQDRFEHFFGANKQSFDLIFIDGDHRYEPTLINYKRAKACLSGIGPIVLHDIYWSKGMKRAWRSIMNDPDATVTIDLFFFGLVFFRPEQQKEHFDIRFPKSLFSLLL